MTLSQVGMPRKKPSGWVMSSSCGTLRPRCRSKIAPATVLRRGRKAERAVIHRLADQLLHRRELFRRCLDALGRGLAHYVAADAGMAHQRADIDAAALAERVQVIADRFPGYINAGFQ